MSIWIVLLILYRSSRGFMLAMCTLCHTGHIGSPYQATVAVVTAELPINICSHSGFVARTWLNFLVIICIHDPPCPLPLNIYI